jgi:hypothetical protein
MADIDGWHARDVITLLFFNDNTELHNLIRKRLVLFSPTLLVPSSHLLLKNMQADF